ncbi:MAG: lipid IV(A) 3-deoxy-D-manno-octulosonic acid transferase [Gammaproteobacteria bacterium]
MRYLYTILFYLISPILLVRLYWRSRRLSAYRRRILERFGYYPFQLEKCIWVHAVSVGETIAAVPFIKELIAHYDPIPVLITNMTPTGAESVKAHFGDSVKQAYIPYDLPGAMQRFLKTMRPVASIIIETELWPNLLHACQKQQIPVCLMNARLSQKSANGYARIAGVTRNMLQQLKLIAAQGPADAERFIALGALPEQVVVTGNLKFDLVLKPDLSSSISALRIILGGAKRFVWVAASTHEGEEEQILAAHKKIREQCPDALLLLVPRHPDRFETVAALCAKNFIVKRRSSHEACTHDTAIYLGDTMGELLAMCGAADVVFMGGSLIARGGHNILEPAALGKPILTGPSLFNFAHISSLFLKANAMKVTTDSDALAEAVVLLIKHPEERERMGKNALEVMNNNRGALNKQLALIYKIVR